MNFKNLLEVLLKSFISSSHKISLFSKFSDIEQLLKLHSSRKYEYIFLNEEKIHKILYENENIIKIQSNVGESSLINLFYIVLLLKSNPYLTNYIYDFEYIENVNNFRKKSDNNLTMFILSMIIIELITNYKNADDYYDCNCEEKLNKIYKENETIRNKYNLKEYNLDINKKDIESNNLEEIYSQIIISLIIKEKIQNYELVNKIFNQLNVKNINLTTNIFENLMTAFNSNETFIKNFTISNMNDLYNQEKINFYYILFKYIFKNSFYIYNIPFLFKIRNSILKIIKKYGKNFSIIENDINITKKIEYVLNIFCDSKYYFLLIKYIREKFEKLNQVLLYYQQFLFVSKLNEIKLLREYINNPKLEIDIEKYLEDYEKAKILNLKSNIIKFLIEETQKNINIEEDIKECISLWEVLEKNIKDRKMKKIKKNYIVILRKYFNNEKNKDLLLKIFTKESYEFCINSINNKDFEGNKFGNNINSQIDKIYNEINEDKRDEFGEEILKITNENKSSTDEKENNSNEINKIKNNEINEIKNNKFGEEISNIINEEKISTNENELSENSKIIEKNSIDQNNNESNIKLYNSEVQNEEIIFSDINYSSLSYIRTIGNHKSCAELIAESNNGYFYSYGEKNIFLYNSNYEKIMDIKDIKNISNLYEVKTSQNPQTFTKIIKLVGCKNGQINLITINTEKLASKIDKFEISFNSTYSCIEIDTNNFIIFGDKGVYTCNDVFNRIGVHDFMKLADTRYKGVVKITKNIIAMSSNKYIKNGDNKLIFYNSKNYKLIREVEGYSFTSSQNGLAVMPKNEEDKIKNKVLLCACKKYASHEKNGILLVNAEMGSKSEIKNPFFDTGNFEVHCFCPISLIKNSNSILIEKITLIEQDYFLVGGFNQKKRKGIIKLFKLIRSENIKETKIEYLQDIEVEKNDNFKGFNCAISSITQSKKDGKILVSCWDGNVYLFSNFNIEPFLKYDAINSYNCKQIAGQIEQKKILIEA